MRRIIPLRKEPINDETIRARDSGTPLFIIHVRECSAISKLFISRHVHYPVSRIGRENIFNPLMGICNPQS